MPRCRPIRDNGSCTLTAGPDCAPAPRNIQPPPAGQCVVIDSHFTSFEGDDTGDDGGGGGDDAGAEGSVITDPSPKACDATDCDGCCDDMGACRDGAEDGACGSGGAACADCSAAGETCAGGMCQ
jgi:hypothetical protein